MKRISVLFLMILLLVNNSELFSQSSTLSKKEQKQIAQQEKEKSSADEYAMKFELMKAMVSSGRFVLESYIQSELNYILIDSLKSAVQQGNRYAVVGYNYYTLGADGIMGNTPINGDNGIGGATINGEVRNYTLKIVERRNSFIIKYDIYGLSGSSAVTIWASSSGYASAQVRNNSGARWPRFTGRIVSLDECSIYKGSREL